MSHTPGPWKHIGGWAVYSQDDRPLARAACAFAADCLRESSEDERWNAESAIPDSEAESNARLIAAAPELLAALKRIIDDFEAKTDASASSYWLPKWEAARAAIAKAEGR